jgi:putative flippase GtrA
MANPCRGLSLKHSLQVIIPLLRQFSSFFWIGLIVVGVHYAVLIFLVEIAHTAVLPATLVGYTSGGVASYMLNRQHTFKTGRPHEEAGWRFIVVAGIGFGLTTVLMWLFFETLHLPYLLAQLVTTGCVMVWSFAAHKFWTFRFVPPA